MNIDLRKACVMSKISTLLLRVFFHPEGMALSWYLFDCWHKYLKLKFFMSLWKQQNRKLDYSYYFNMDVIYLLVNSEIIIVLGLDYHLKINRIAYKKKRNHQFLGVSYVVFFQETFMSFLCAYVW